MTRFQAALPAHSITCSRIHPLPWVKCYPEAQYDVKKPPRILPALPIFQTECLNRLPLSAKAPLRQKRVRPFAPGPASPDGSLPFCPERRRKPYPHHATRPPDTPWQGSQSPAYTPGKAPLHVPNALLSPVPPLSPLLRLCVQSSFSCCPPLNYISCLHIYHIFLPQRQACPVD